MLTIVGKPKDVELYAKMRQITNGIDPATGQAVKYGGLKKLGAAGDQVIKPCNNPWLKYGNEYSILGGDVKSLNRVEVGVKDFKFDPEQRLDIAGMANANIIDRYDERVNPAGGIFTDFMKNPVLLLDHFYITSVVVGTVTKLDPEADGVHFEAFVGDPTRVGGSTGLTQTQKDTRSLIAQRMIRTVSIGFIPTKIRAPLFNDEGKLEEPAIIEQWKLLEISLVAIPANQGSIFEAKAYAYSLNTKGSTNTKGLTTGLSTVNTNTKLLGVTQKGVVEVIGDPDAFESWQEKKGQSDYKFITQKQIDIPDGATVQTLMFNKDNFSLEDATAWAKEHNFKADKVDDNDDTYEFRQQDPSKFVEDSFKTIELETGLRAVIGRLKEKDEDMDNEKAQELTDAIKTMTTTVSDAVKGLQESNEKILGGIQDLKGSKPKPKEGEGDPDKDDDQKSLDERVEAIEKDIGDIKTAIKNIDDFVADKLINN